MTHNQKINYMRIAAGISGFSIQNEHLDLLVSVYEMVTEKEGKTSLSDIVNVEHEVEKRSKERREKELAEQKNKK
jgi:hypothetical protein